MTTSHEVQTNMRTRTILGIFALAVVVGCAPPDSTVDGQQSALMATSGDSGGGGGGYPPPPTPCLTNATGWIYASPSEATLNGGTTISWALNTGSTTCTVTQSIHGPGLYDTRRSGSKLVIPPSAGSNGYAFYELWAFANGQSKNVATLSVKLKPRTTLYYGRTYIYIDYDWQTQSFVDAIATPNATVILADDLNLDLTGRHDLNIETGVHIVGGRSPAKLGPRLFTTATRTYGPAPLFAIGQYVPADGVRITGVRIDGGDMGIAGNGITQDDDPTTPIGIAVNWAVNVEIANSEIYGWSGTAVQIKDDGNRVGRENSTAVWVHDNYIHHNQRYRHEGYGVATTPGAYALVERNVFDYNRHSLESNGASGTGYRAYHNLQLEHGGVNSLVTRTHVFDVHGTLECDGKDAYCGQAGEYYDYRHNTLLYTAGDVIKVRGEPQIRAEVTGNVFAKDEGSEAVSQTEGTNLHVWANTFSVNPYSIWKSPTVGCDFEGDGVPDDFMATGNAWWFLSSTTQQWFFLNASPRKYTELTLADQDGDGLCDVKVNATGAVYAGGRAGRTEKKHADLVFTREPTQGWSDGTARVWQLSSDLGSVANVVPIILSTDQTPFNTTGRVLGTGDFNRDGATDLIWRDVYASRIWIQLRDSGANGILPGSHKGSTFTHAEAYEAGTRVDGTWQSYDTLGFQGTGDFNGDGRSDILWRKDNGQLVIWMGGEAGNAALVTWLNDTIKDANNVVKPLEVPVTLDWKVKGIGDFNGDGYADILWRHDGGQVTIWYMEHAMHVDQVFTGGADPYHVWEIQGVGDFNGDGKDDILWRSNSGPTGLAIWFDGRYEAGQAYPTWQNIPGWVVGQDWQIHAVGDFNGDGKADILWRDIYAGSVSIWKMDGGTWIGQSAQFPADSEYPKLGGLMNQAPVRLDLN
jgi:FG-GAP-like repeat/Right handed beta helix region/FG-GAP repeat